MIAISLDIAVMSVREIIYHSTKRRARKELLNFVILLFKQPESTHLGDCPICMLPMPLDRRQCTSMNCCSKFVCDGCYHANLVRELEAKMKSKCPFVENWRLKLVKK